MIDELKLFNLPAGHKLPSANKGEIFILSTCQRTLAIGFNLIPYKTLGAMPKETSTIIGSEAYIFLLETICGLKSKVLGENEIVDQFKVAYNSFMALPRRNSYIQRIIEKLFKDAKSIRSSYLLGLGQLSYAGIARKLISSKATTGNVLIIGSGQLAKDCAKLLNRKYNLSISARKQSKIESLKSELSDISIKTVEFKNYENYQSFSLIINTIGCSGLTLFNQDFFENWSPSKNKLFIDLGSPSVVETTHGILNDVYCLSDIFSLSESLNTQKLKKVSEAKVAMKHLVEKRNATYSLHFPYAWEDMQFA